MAESSTGTPPDHTVMTLGDVMDGLRDLEISDVRRAPIEIRTAHCGSFEVTNVAWQNHKAVLWGERAD